MVEFEMDPAEALLVCRFDGRMDAAVNADAQNAVDAKLASLLPEHADRLAVVFDVENVTFVSSAFLRICMTAAQRVGAGRFSVRGTNPTLKKIFLVAGLDAVFPIA